MEYLQNKGLGGEEREKAFDRDDSGLCDCSILLTKYTPKIKRHTHTHTTANVKMAFVVNPFRSFTKHSKSHIFRKLLHIIKGRVLKNIRYDKNCI